MNYRIKKVYSTKALKYVLRAMFLYVKNPVYDHAPNEVQVIYEISLSPYFRITFVV